LWFCPNNPCYPATRLKLLVEVQIHALVLGVSDVHILFIFYPYTVGTLSNRLSEAISSGVCGR
jgi:hypothetical protein